MLRIRIGRADNYAFDTGADNCLGAGGSAPVGAAWLERKVKRRAFRAVPSLLRIANGFDLCVRLARAAMPATADYFAALRQHRADHRVWRARPVTARRE